MNASASSAVARKAIVLLAWERLGEEDGLGKHVGRE